MMYSNLPQRDLIVLVADNNMHSAIKGLLNRPRSFGIVEINYNILIHMHRDPGILNEAHEFLRPFARQYKYCLVLFDREGCGKDNVSVDALETEVQNRLEISGWKDRVKVVVLDPELENWVWSDSPWVERCLGWQGHQNNIREWLKLKGLWDEGDIKPKDPKGAVEAALREVRKPRSSSIYLDLARNVSFQRCTDQAFLRLKDILQSWFAS